MASIVGKVNVSDISKRMTCTITVTGMKRFRLRMWIAMQLIRLAALVMPCNVKVEEPNGPSPT